MTQTPAEYVDGSADVTSLTDLGAQLPTQAHDHSTHRAATTVISGTHQRATLLALAANTDLAEHDAPPAANLQVITGHVRLCTPQTANGHYRPATLSPSRRTVTASAPPPPSFSS
jgi:hypothetical protein